MSTVNRRRVYGEPVPYDAKVEYLESTGTQWIDTGIKFDTTKHGVFVDGIFINDLSGIRTIAGCWEGSFNVNHLTCAIGGNYQNCYFLYLFFLDLEVAAQEKKLQNLVLET